MLQKSAAEFVKEKVSKLAILMTKHVFNATLKLLLLAHATAEYSAQ